MSNKELSAASRPPVILFGHGRSGTSILGRLMRDYLRIAFGTESQFILSYHSRISAYEPLADEGNLRRLIQSLLGERWFRRSRKFKDFQLTEQQIFDAVQERTYAGVLNAIFSLFADHLGMPRWGDKTPDYIEDLDTIDELFPDAQYVYIVRDGRDVALSLQHIHFGPKNIFTAAHDWRQIVRKGDAFAEKLPARRLFSLRYEDLLDDPAGQLKAIGQYLYEGHLPAELAEAIDREVPSVMMRNNYGKWRQEWTESQRIAYERIACRELRKHGYRTLVTTPADSASGLQWMYWKTLSELGKWKFPEYWQDNLYKARLRIHRM